MRSHLPIVFLVVLLVSAPAFSQILACNSIQGDWEFYYDHSTYSLSQDNLGNISGLYADFAFCPGQFFPITGTITSGSFSFTVTGLNACPGGGAQWLTYTGYLGQPGCNYAYGNWSNSLGHNGGFGQSDAYPPLGESDIFTKPVDVPTAETSITPTGAQWDTNYGPPWIQTFAPNTPSGEFEGRVVYEYVTGQGTDNCWFKGSSVNELNAVTKPGFGWTVSSRNTWGTDYIGWNLAAVRYYRSKKRAPCTSSFKQQMVIDAAYAPDNPASYSGPYFDQYGNSFYGVAYEINSLGASITATTSTSVRNAQTSTNTTWK